MQKSLQELGDDKKLSHQKANGTDNSGSTVEEEEGLVDRGRAPKAGKNSAKKQRCASSIGGSAKINMIWSVKCV